jgi:hypothetical protein
MSISAATNRPTSTGRLAFPQIALAVVGVLVLFSVLVAISVSSTGSGTARGIGATNGTAPGPAVAARGYFRDPASHALLSLTTSSPSEATPGPGHK